jgi:uncharacterized membrane protein YcaP (DUF421 family)
MDHLIGGAGELGWVAIKALLLYLTAVFAFRVGQRRTLADFSAFDFVAAVAVGAIVGRVPNAHDASYLAGLATLAAVLFGHWCLTRLRRFPGVARLLEHTPRLLVAQGRVLDDELRRCGLTRSDLYGLLRRQGVGDLSEVRFAVFEQRGQVSVIRRTDPSGPEPALVRDIAARAPPGRWRCARRLAFCPLSYGHRRTHQNQGPLREPLGSEGCGGYPWPGRWLECACLLAPPSQA